MFSLELLPLNEDRLAFLLLEQSKQRAGDATETVYKTMFWPKVLVTFPLHFFAVYTTHEWNINMFNWTNTSQCLSETLMKTCVGTLRFWWNASSETSKEPSNTHSAIHQEPLDGGSCCQAPCYHFVLDLKWTLQLIPNGVSLRLQSPEHDSAPHMTVSVCGDRH